MSPPPLEKPPRILTFLKNFGQIPQCVGSLDGQCATSYNGGQKNLGLCAKALPSNSSVGLCS